MRGIVNLKPFTVSDLMGFRFIKIPVDIKNHDSIFGKISLQACLFYAFLLDRMSLSLSNGWYDESGDAYIYYTVDEAKHDMRCSCLLYTSPSPRGRQKSRMPSSA